MIDLKEYRRILNDYDSSDEELANFRASLNTFISKFYDQYFNDDFHDESDV